MTHDELLETIDFLPLDGLHHWMQPALRAVVELHKPDGRCCSHCVMREDYEVSEYLYPCPTIQAIEKELS